MLSSDTIPAAIESAGDWRQIMRRRYQRGSLAKEGNRWVARWREDVTLPSGDVKRIRRKEILGSAAELPTKKLAQRELDKRLEPINHEDYRPASTVTFALFADKWKREIMIHHKPSSQSSERSIIDSHLVSFFGPEQLRNINAEMIQRFVNASENQPKTVKNHVSLLMVMWDQVKAWEYASHNPFPRGTNGRLLIKLPLVVKGKYYCFTVEETLAIIDKAQGRWKVFFRILAETGMRPGELAGLRACDVGERTIRIAQSVWQQTVQTPKTDNAVRTFAISASLAEEIRRMIDAETAEQTADFASAPICKKGFVSRRGSGGEQEALRASTSLRGVHGGMCELPQENRLGSDAQRVGYPKDARVERYVVAGKAPSSARDQGLIFTTEPSKARAGKAPRYPGGRPLSMDNFRNRVLNPILEELGILAKIKALGIRGGNYAFRHMNATVMDGLHTPLKTRQKRLGHAQIETTLEHYTHAIDADDLAAADALGALLSPKQEGARVQ